MTVVFSEEQILELFEKNAPLYENSEICLAKLVLIHNIKPCCVIKSSIDFCRRKFWKKLKALRNGNEDANVVLLYIHIFHI
jgi:hypothetical protein